MNISKATKRINAYLQRHCDPGHPMWEEQVYNRIRQILKEERDRADGIPVTEKENQEGAWEMEWIRKTYNVPAKLGGRVKFKGKPGTILGTQGQYLLIQLDREKFKGPYHPVWEMEYLAD